MFPKGILQTLEREYNRDSPSERFAREGDTGRDSDLCLDERIIANALIEVSWVRISV